MADLSQTSTPSTAPVGAVVSSPEPISVNLSATGNAKAEDVPSNSGYGSFWGLFVDGSRAGSL